MDILKSCNLCPHNCLVNRYTEVGACGASSKIKVAYYSLHMWEEPVISGNAGSGTIFFSNCNLKCIFCQNKKISNDGYGKEISNDRLSEIFMELQKKGANNINLVTPTHYVPQIVESIHLSKDKGLKLPIVYNTSSYENTNTIKLLNGLVNIYLADLKYYDDNLAVNYSHCKNYFKYATDTIDEMYEQVGKFIIKDDLMKSGLIVRILVLPGHINDAKKIIKYLYQKYNDSIFISIMNQYTPLCNFKTYTNLNRKLYDKEYDEVVDYACNLGIKNAFIQEGSTQDESFIPDFDCSII